MALPTDPWAYSYGTHCGFWAYCAYIYDIAITPSFLLTHYFLHVYDPRDHIIWERTSQSQEGKCFIRVEEWDNDHYWITCWMDYTGVKSHSSWLRLDPNPQDMLSQLDQVGSMMWLWWDIFLNHSMVLMDAILVTGREMQGEWVQRRAKWSE